MTARQRAAVAAGLVALLACTTAAWRNTAAPAPWVVQENARSGATRWAIAAAAGTGAKTVGFLDHASVLPGQQVQLFVSSPRPFAVRAFRIGWYGGARARLVWSSPAHAADRQAVARVDPTTHMVDAPWHPTMPISTAGWLPGDYLFRLDGARSGSSYVPLTVRAASTAGTVVLVNATTTWQAYNKWGCCDLYNGSDGAFATRSRVVSFDRPYDNSFGAGQFIARELPVVAEAERLGLPLSYVTDTDIDADPHLLAGARAVITMGHDEYWSAAMRSAVTVARDSGTNIAFLGANAVYRRIRLRASSLGPEREIVDYKVAREDPLSAGQPRSTTADWASAPAADPESSLTGGMYKCIVPLPRADGVVASTPSWLFAGASVNVGTRLPGLIGPETDAVTLSDPTPRPLQILLHSPQRCASGAASTADTTYYTVPSGAGVFDAGTIDWTCDVGGGCKASGITATVVRQLTDNLLRAFAAGPAGRAHPAVDNVAAVQSHR